MHRRVFPVATMLAGAVVVSLASSSAAQTPTRANSQQVSVPRTPWNHPDLQGRWTNATVTPLQRPPELAGKEFFSGNEAAEYQKTAQKRYLELSGFTISDAEFSGEFAPEWMEDRPLVSTGRTSLIIGPDGQIPPFTPEARKRADARAAKGFDAADAPEDRSLGERCLLFAHAGPPMLPGMLYNSNYQIVQTPSHVVIFAEMGSSVRIITLNRRQHLGEALRSWHGDSIGRWEDETLVVDTTNLNEKSEFRGATANIHVVERFTTRACRHDPVSIHRRGSCHLAETVDRRTSDAPAARTYFRVRLSRGELRSGQHSQGCPVCRRSAEMSKAGE